MRSDSRPEFTELVILAAIFLGQAATVAAVVALLLLPLVWGLNQ